MTDRSRFQYQNLNSEDYEKAEEGAKLVKDGAKIFGAFVIAGGLLKKYGPNVIKSFNKIRKS